MVCYPFVMERSDGVRPPSEIAILVEGLKKVRRYVQDDYPEGVVIDNTYSHELRCAQMAIALKEKHSKFTTFNFELLERIIWLHDLGELDMEHDITAILQARNNSIIGEKVRDENMKVSELLSGGDLELFNTLETAGNALKGKGDWGLVTPEAAVAYLIDKTDSNMCFHFWVSQSTETFPPDSLIYTFTQYEKFMTNLDFCPYQEVVTMGKELLNEQLAIVSKLWSEIPEETRPTPLRLG